MTTLTAIWAFTLAAALATVTPGLDTALVLRTATVEGRRRALMAAFGIGCGVLTWGSAAALGLAELFRVSAVAYEIVRWAGAAYLVYLGGRMLLRPRVEFAPSESRSVSGEGGGSSRIPGIEWFVRGLLTNLLNPKVGIFYVSFLPQFIPADSSSPRGLMLLFAAIHAVEGILWFTMITFATDRIAPVLRRPRFVKLLDQAMGTLFIGFGVRLAISRNN
jgi:threonine/homoserine/homoserine lactone efflux protein